MTHHQAVELMKMLAVFVRKQGVGEHSYVVGGAVRNYLMGKPIKDIDVMVDSVALEGYDSARFAQDFAAMHAVETNLTTNQYGVAILTLKLGWGSETLEIATAHKESYGGDEGKGYKPHLVEPATAMEDAL